MKKNRMLFLFLAAVSAFTFSACSDDDNDAHNNSVVSKQVQETFNSQYPQAKSVEWKVKGSYAVADFHLEGTEHEAWYNPSSAEWYMTESDIPYEALPQPVKTAFKSSEYADWRVDDVDMLSREGMETVYVIEAEQGKQEVDLYYSSEGVLIKAETDNDSNDDHEDFIPQPDLNDFSALIKEMFPNARILDIEKEKEYIEVSIWDDNREKDVYFDSAKTWVGTCWDIRTSELPEAVKQAVIAQYSTFEIDDIEFVKTASEEWYILDLENKTTDSELEGLKIKADGTWIK